jgi:multiple sugar transport system substrate-binding protein
VKSKFATFLLAAALVLASNNGFSAGSDISANLRLMAFGGDAQLKAVTNAVARFNQKSPNVKVEISIDPITNGWGDYVTRVLSQFNANNAYDVYGTAIETFRTFETRNLFIPLDDYIAGHASYSDFDPALFKYASLQGQDVLYPDRMEQHHDQLQPEAVQGCRC